MKKIIKNILLFLLFVPVCTAGCKNTAKTAEKGSEELVITRLQIMDGTETHTVDYSVQAPEVVITKPAIRLEDVKAEFKGAAAVNYKITPDLVRPLTPEGVKFKIIADTPPAGFKRFSSKDITVKRSIVAPKVISLTVCGVPADITKTPFEVRIKKNSVEAPIPGLFAGDVQVSFDKEVSPETLQYSGLPLTSLIPEEPREFTIKVPEMQGRYKAADFRVKVTFDTPELKIAKLSIKDQNGDTNLVTLSVNMENKITGFDQNAVTVKFGGDFIEPSVLSAIVPSYEGLPISGLEVLKPKTFKIKVAALDKKYKAFEKDITVIRQNPSLELVSLKVKDQNVITGGGTNTVTVGKETTLIRPGDITAVFRKDGAEVTLPVLLAEGNKAAVYANNEEAGNHDTDVVFFLPSTNEYAEYRGTIKVTYPFTKDNMIEVPMPPGGATFKSGLRDEADKKIETRFEIGQFAVTKELWDEVCDWAITQMSNGEHKYKNFEILKAIGQRGTQNPASESYNPYPDSVEAQPVVGITWHGAMAWCNAYSEKLGYAPAYYKREVTKNPDTDITYETRNGGMTTVQVVNVDQDKTAEQLAALAIRDADPNHDWSIFSPEIIERHKANFYYAPVLTAKQVKADGKKNGFRMLHPDEWEYAARLRIDGGPYIVGAPIQVDGTTYYFANKDCAAGSDGIGEENSEIAKVAWFSDNSNHKTHRVGSRRSTDIGIYDLSGNVSVWTSEVKKADGTPEPKSAYLFSTNGGFYDWGIGRLMVVSKAPAINGGYSHIGLRVARTLD